MTRGPYPDDVAGLLTAADADAAKTAVADLRGRDRTRLDAVRSAVDADDTGD